MRHLQKSYANSGHPIGPKMILPEHSPFLYRHFSGEEEGLGETKLSFRTKILKQVKQKEVGQLIPTLYSVMGKWLSNGSRS